MRLIVLFIFFIGLIQPVNLNAQEIDIQNFRIPDSLVGLSIDELIDKRDVSLFGSVKHKIYTLSALQKAKSVNDTIVIAWSYFMMYGLEKKLQSKKKHLDNLFKLTFKWEHEVFPGAAYELKARFFYESGDFQGALDNFETALEWARKFGDTNGEWYVKANISALRSEWGDHREALKINKENLAYIISQPEYKTGWGSEYLNAMSAVSNSYLGLGILDSALIAAKKGYRESLILQDTLYSKKFSLVVGLTHYYKQNYVACVDSLRTLRPFFMDTQYQLYTHLYEGLSLYELGQHPEALVNLEKTDSIYQATQREFPELKELYQTFIDYYRKNGDIENQLKYINKLLKADSVLIENYRYVGDNLSKKIDVPLFLAEKDKLLTTESKKKKTWIYATSLLGIVSLAGLVLFFLYHQKQRKYKRLFYELLAKNKKSKPEKAVPIGIDLNPDLVTNILRKLELFEQKKTYLRPRLTLSQIANELKTNTSYLSKVINSTKQKSFVNYINDLRIDYLIKKLQEDEKYRQYSVRALQEEVGYTNGPSFTKAFYQRTGLYPSWFIRQLNKREAS